MEQPRLQVRGLARRFGRITAVGGVDLDVERGEIVALLGPNGAGKTTTLTAIAGIIRPSAGTIAVDGLTDAATRERRVAYVPEMPIVYDDLSAREHLVFVANARRVPDPERVVDDALHRTGLADVADRAAGTYSKGMRQRVCLAGALVADAAVVLLDEPTTGLDPLAQEQVLAMVRELAARGAAVVFSTHMLPLALAVATRIVIVAAGRVCSDAPCASYAGVEALRDAYRHFTAT
jgi:ABC-2 type transport system ATP-binding protein